MDNKSFIVVPLMHNGFFTDASFEANGAFMYTAHALIATGCSYSLFHAKNIFPDGTDIEYAKKTLIGDEPVTRYRHELYEDGTQSKDLYYKVKIDGFHLGDMPVPLRETYINFDYDGVDVLGMDIFNKTIIQSGRALRNMKKLDIEKGSYIMVLGTDKYDKELNKVTQRLFDRVYIK